jgi:predicted methyltransferase MtxX (methanogen marker protein 4)
MHPIHTHMPHSRHGASIYNTRTGGDSTVCVTSQGRTGGREEHVCTWLQAAEVLCSLLLGLPEASRIIDGSQRSL